MALDRPRTISQLTVTTKMALNSASARNHVTLRWIKAHAGHLGNETADTVARQGADDETRIQDDLPEIPMKNFRRKYRQAFAAKWQTYWDNRKDCRQTKLWMPHLSKQHSYDLLKSSRRRLSILV